MTVDTGQQLSLRVALALALLAGAVPHVLAGAAPARTSHASQDNASARDNSVASGEQAQAAQLPAGPPRAPGQLQLGGKCASKGSCARELASRRLDLDSGSDKQACHCDQLCAAYDDCCRDARWAEPLAKRLDLGLERLRARRKQWQCRRISPIYGDVLLRAACQPDWLAGQPDDKEALLTKQRCETPELDAAGQQADPMGSLMPITDLASGVTYANSHCLRCNPRRAARANPGGGGGGAKLIYWSPLVSCNYNLDLDDRNTLYDLISSKKGQALRYSSRRNRWLVRLRPSAPGGNSRLDAENATATAAATAAAAPDERATNDEEELQEQRVCVIQPTIPDSVEHFVRHCRARMIDACPATQAANSSRWSAEELRQARLECHFGHQSLVYSQTSDLVYFNLACARCHEERQVFCEPRLKKQLAGPVSRITGAPSGQRVLGAPAEPLDGPETGASPAPGLGGDNQLDNVPELGRSGGEGSFSVLFDLNGGDSGEQVGAVHRCEDAERQVFDPFLLTCRDVACGLNHRFVDGACVQVDATEASNLASVGSSPSAAGLPSVAGQLDEAKTPPGGAQANMSSGAGPTAHAGDHSQVQVARGTAESAAGRDKLGRQTSVGEDERPPSSSGPAPLTTRRPQDAVAADKSQSSGRPARLEVALSASTESAATAGAEGARLVGSSGHWKLGQPADDTQTKGDSDISFNQLLAGLKPDELPRPTGESRRAFAECAKILIEPEHYRLFTSADLAAGGRAINQTGGASESPGGRPASDVNFLAAGEHQRQRDVWALVSPYNLTLASSQFELVRGISISELQQQQQRQQQQPQQQQHQQQQQEPGQPALRLLVCSPFKSDLVAKFKPTMEYLTTCCLAVSIASLVCFLLLYGLSTFDLRHLVVELTQAGRADDALRTDALDSKFRGSRASTDTSYNATRSQNLSSRGVACLATALLAAYLLFILGHQLQQQQQQQQQDQAQQPPPANPQGPTGLTGCTLIAAATFCSFLVAFNWMFLLSYDIWRTLRLATCQLRAPTMSSQSRRFVVYALCAIGAALAVTALALAIDQMDPPPSGCPAVGRPALAQPAEPAGTSTCRQSQLERLLQLYRPKFGARAGSCWFSNRRSLALFFGLPVMLIMFVNLLFFLHSSFMVIKTSSRSSRRLAATNSNFSAGTRVTCVLAHSNRTADCKQEQQHYLVDQMDFAQQNGLTTSSLSSVQTIQSNLSLRSESDSGSGDEGAPGGAGCGSGESTSSRDEGPPVGQLQAQIIERIGSASRRLDEEARLSAAAAKRRSFRSAKQESSSSLISGGSGSHQLAGQPPSLAANLAQKYDAHLNNLSALVSSIVKDYRLYCRLSTIMGLTWLTGLMASVVDQSELLWYLFVVLNTLQGLFIFVAFGFKRSRLTNLEILASYARFRLAVARGSQARSAGEPSDKLGRPACRAGDF